MDTAIQLTNITKAFNIPKEKLDSIQERLLSFKFRSATSKFKALDNITLSVKKGDWIGVIGPNGSGKSTMLKIIAGIYRQDSGKIEVTGHLIPFLELGVGFNLELSAKDNIYLNGVILGMSRKKIKSKFDTIVSFANIKPFINQKLKNFSSGMQVRLAFSIAMQSSGDIFLLDEVLAVGDYQFQQKCDQVFKVMKKNRKTALLVSHDLDSILKYCNHVIWIDHGKIVSSGDPNTVIKQYTRFVS